MKIYHIITSLLLTFCSCDKPEPGFIVPIPSPDDKEEVTEKPDTPEETPEETPVPAGGNIIVGYATYWDTRMPDPTLLTHINYAFALIKDDFESLDVKKPARLKQIVALKSQNPDLNLFFFFWKIIAFQCCVSFRRAEK